MVNAFGRREFRLRGGQARRAARATEAVLAESGGFQIVVGLNDLPEAVLGGAVAAVGIGVKLLDQRLVAGLDFAAAFAAVEVECGK